MTARPVSNQLSLSLVLACGSLAGYASAGNGQLVSPVYVDSAAIKVGLVFCAGNLPCYPTIAQAVAAAGGGSPTEIRVFPGNYAESVNLNTLGSCCGGGPEDVRLVTVDASDVETPGTATVSPADGPAFWTNAAFSGDIEINGFNVSSVAGADADAVALEVNSDILIDSVTVTSAVDDGIDAIANTGNITVLDSSATSCGDDGFDLDAAGNIVIMDSSANDNTSEGFIMVAGGDVTIDPTEANGNGDDGFDIDIVGATAVVSLTDLTANDNGEDGIDVDDQTSGGAVVRVTTSMTSGNGECGMDLDAGARIDVAKSTMSGNGLDGLSVDNAAMSDVTDNNITNNLVSGVNYPDELPGSASLNLSCNNITGNADGVVIDTGVLVTATDNWWGAASGPTHPDNPGGMGDSIVDALNGGFGSAAFTGFLPAGFENGCPAMVVPFLPALPAAALALSMLAGGWVAVGRRRRA